MKSETKRQKQVAEIIKRNFSLVLQQEGVYIYGNVLVTVTNVQMSPDLSLASIYLSVYNTENKQAVILELEDSHTRLRQSLGSRIRKQLRRVPDIQFFLDDTLDEINRVNAIFERLDAEKTMRNQQDKETE